MPSATDVPFLAPDPNDRFFVVPQKDGIVHYYHGTSEWFSKHVEQNGFLLQHSLLSDEECRAIRTHSKLLPFVESYALDCLCSGYRLSLTRHSLEALKHASGEWKGGRFREAGGVLYRLLVKGASLIPDPDRLVLKQLTDRLKEISEAPGVVYVIELNNVESNRLEGVDPYYASFDIAPERIAYRMTIPLES